MKMGLHDSDPSERCNLSKEQEQESRALIPIEHLYSTSQGNDKLTFCQHLNKEIEQGKHPITVHNIVSNCFQNGNI